MNLSKLQFPASPNLPLAPREWHAQYQDQFANVLRLYFNQLSGLLQELSAPKGGYHLNFPFGAFHDTTTQTVASTTTAYVITFDTTDYANDVSMVSSSKITFAKAGVYNIQFSAQLSNDANQPQDIDIWFRKNGANIADSNTRFGLPAHKSAGDPSHTVGTVNILVDVVAGDYVQLVWCSTDIATVIQSYTAGTAPTRPAIPSMILTVSFVSSPLE